PREPRQAVDARRIAPGGQVEPAAAAWTSGRGPVLLAGLAQPAGFLHRHFARERAEADTRRIGLRDADHLVDRTRAEPDAERRTRGARRRAGDEGIRAVVQIEQRALSALEQDLPPPAESLSQLFADVGDERLQPGDRGPP